MGTVGKQSQQLAGAAPGAGSRREVRRGALRTGAAVAGAVAVAPAALLAAGSGAGALEGPTLEARLGERVFGQAGAIATVAGVLRRAATRPALPGRPAGSFLFVGPQGVGKTMLAKELARVLNGSPDDLLRLDMTAFADAQTAPRLAAGHAPAGAASAPAGRVVLLDTIERAHPAVQALLASVLGGGTGGRLRDAAGRVVDVTGGVVIMATGAPTAATAVGDALRARIDAVAVFDPLDRSRLPFLK